MANPVPSNLYVHFPFCRRKCTYCVLPSRAGVAQATRDAYVGRLAAIAQEALGDTPLDTIYFGGGSPALCDLLPLLKILRPHLKSGGGPRRVYQGKDGVHQEGTEFTVELHPLDATEELLSRLRDNGVNRISMGVQSLDDNVLRHMGRGYTADEAERAFARVKRHFDNAGIDLIVGYPATGEGRDLTAGDGPRLQRIASWGLRHCSVYSLILEDDSILAHQLRRDRTLRLPTDDLVLDEIRRIRGFLDTLGLERYEISSYAVPGYACRHNLATWRGEDYLGLGDGACGRIGRARTRNFGGQTPETVQLAADEDALERKIFTLRTTDGLDTSDRPEWKRPLDRFVEEGLLTKEGPVYRLTERGTEVCDTILAELV